MAPPQAATTLRRAKAQYKKAGPVPTISSSEQRQLARAAELDRRAQFNREREQRRKKAEKARMEREEKEARTRRQLGIGLATQLVGYSLSQRGMKGGMEGWLGVGKGAKRKRDVEEEIDEAAEEASAKQDTVEEENGGNKVELAPATESFGSNMSLDDVLLGQLDTADEQPRDNESPTEVASQTTIDNGVLRDARTREPISPANSPPHIPTWRPPQDSNTTSPPPPTKRVKTKSSPTNEWAQFVEGNTQILHELSRTSPPEIKADPRIVLPPMSMQDLELNSDDFIETGLPKTTNPTINPKDGVVVRDFAYFKATESGSFTLKVPNAPALSRRSRSERSILRSFGRKPIMTASPALKMTATCSTFKAEQCSFNADYHRYGLSTPLLQQAIDDGDDDTESEDEEVYSQALEECKVPDHVLMPPPPMTLSPKVFKPPTSNNTLFAGKGGLHIFGLSTQLLNEAVDDDQASTDEDSDDALFSVPISRPVEKTLKPPATLRRTSSAFGGFGLSTQMLQQVAGEEVELTDEDDTQGS